VAILLENNLDVGPAGTVISVTNSDDNGDDAFNVVDSAGSGVTCQYVAVENLPSSAYVGEFATGNSARAPGCTWSFGSQNHFWIRFYSRWNTLTTKFPEDSLIFGVFNGSTLMGGVGMPGVNPTLYDFVDLMAAPASYYVFTPYTLTEGAWVRIEQEYVYNSPAWTVNGRLYDGDELLSEISGAGMYSPSLTTIDSVKFGYVVSGNHYDPVQMCGLAVSLDDWIGSTPRQHKGWPNMQPRTLAARHDSSW